MLHILLVFLTQKFCFLEQTSVHSKTERFPYSPCPPITAPPSLTCTSDGKFVTTDEPTLTCHHPKSTVSTRVHLAVGHSMGLGKFIIRVSYRGFHCPQTLRALPVCPPSPLTIPDRFTVTIILPFPDCHTQLTLEQCEGYGRPPLHSRNSVCNCYSHKTNS